MKELTTQVAQRKLKAKIPLGQLSVVQNAADKVAANAVEKVLDSLGDQFKETFAPTSYPVSGLVIKAEEDKLETPAPSPQAASSSVTKQIPSTQKSLLERLQDYVASWFSWMWA